MRDIVQFFKGLFSATWHIPLWGKVLLVVGILAACIAGKTFNFGPARIMAGEGFESGGSWILLGVIVVCVVALVKSCGVDY